MNPIFFKKKKTNCFILQFNDSCFSYSAAVKHKPPTTTWGSTKPESVPTLEEHWVCWSYGELVQGAILEESPHSLPLYDFCLIRDL